MSNNTRILNVSRGFHLKHSQALKAIEHGACEWVEYGISIRSLTIAESIAKRAQQQAQQSSLAAAEIPGLIFTLPERYGARTREEIRLSWEANRFFQTASA